jgi:hypothetical protein
VGETSVDIEKLATHFEERASKAEKLSERISATPVSEAADSESLIKGVAANLATIRSARGGEVGDYEKQIKRRQKFSD